MGQRETGRCDGLKTGPGPGLTARMDEGEPYPSGKAPDGPVTGRGRPPPGQGWDALAQWRERVRRLREEEQGDG